MSFSLTPNLLLILSSIFSLSVIIFFSYDFFYIYFRFFFLKFVYFFSYSFFKKKKLFLDLVKEAKDNNLGRMEWTCLNWNEPSINFYKSLGARGMDEWTTYRLDENQFVELVK